MLNTAAKTGYAEASWVLGDIAQRGVFGEADPDSAKAHYRSALQGGHPEAAFALAQLTQADNTREADDYAKLGRAILLNRALGGDPDSARELAEIHRKGVFVTVDRERAQHWYEQAAAANDRRALITLAKAYDNSGWLQPAPERVTVLYRRAAQAGSLQAALALSNGFTTAQEASVPAAEAVLWLERAVAVGSLQAMLELANWYGQGGKGIEQNKERANELLQAAAGAVGDDPTAHVIIGQAYQDGIYGDPDPVQALVHFRRAAELGNDRGMYQLGLAYADGVGIDSDPAAAFGWFQRAAQAGTISAMLKLAEAYHQGSGVDANIKAATAWYSRAAREGGSVNAMLALAKLYRDEDNPDQDQDAALQWLQQAAEAGSTTAMVELGRVYSGSELVEQDLQTAARWLERAAERNNGTAMITLGDLHSGRFGPPVDYAKAIAWYRIGWRAGLNKAGLQLAELLLEEDQAEESVTVYRQLAETGNVSAAIQLAILYANGKAVPQDLEEAGEWLKRAEESGAEVKQRWSIGYGPVGRTEAGFDLPQRARLVRESRGTGRRFGPRGAGAGLPRRPGGRQRPRTPVVLVRSVRRELA
ncbi:MAG: SEL1-like repeat protein [Candidatus Competibacteraceae bacterium]